SSQCRLCIYMMRHPVLRTTTPHASFGTSSLRVYPISDFIPAERWSAPRAARRSRVNGAPQRKLLSARDGNVLLSIGHCLKAQYDALAPPIPPHMAALVEQLERQRLADNYEARPVVQQQQQQIQPKGQD